MNGAMHLRYEVLRTLRNRVFYGITIGLPLLLFLGIASGQRHSTFNGTSFPLYFMTAMAVYGSMFAVVGVGGRIARDRTGGWTRQLRITPLRLRTDLTAKVIGAYLLAVPTLVLLFLAGAGLGVRLSASHWLELTGLILVGQVPFVVIGFVLGYLMTTDALTPALGGVVILFSLFGGVYGFELAKSGPLFDFMKALPSYWLVQAGKSVVSGTGGWPAEAWVVIAAWTVVLVPLAWLAYRRSTARAA
jgi:ABC-2 type transport system permease protein